MYDPFWDYALEELMMLPTAEAREMQLVAYAPEAAASLYAMFQERIAQTLRQIEAQLPE